MIHDFEVDVGTGSEVSGGGCNRGLSHGRARQDLEMCTFWISCPRQKEDWTAFQKWGGLESLLGSSVEATLFFPAVKIRVP